jgi:hypothetical protein
MSNEASNLIPPYVSWGVFKSTIDTLAETTVPTGPMDRRVLHGLSGADHGALMSALRFLGLADSLRKATPAYRELVLASKSPEKFTEMLLGILDAKYSAILEKVSLESGTISELEKAFKEQGVAQGQMLTKTIRFFVKAYTECGTKLSFHITKPSPKAPRANKGNGDKGRARVGKHPAEQTPTPATDALPKGIGRLPIPGMANAFIQYPLDLTDAQCTLLEGAVAFLKVYVTGKIGREPTP